MPIEASEHEFGATDGEIAEIRDFLAENATEAYSIEELTEGLYEDHDAGLDSSFGKAIVTAYVNVLAYHGEIESCVLRREGTQYYRIAE